MTENTSLPGIKGQKTALGNEKIHNISGGYGNSVPFPVSMKCWYGSEKPLSIK
jgi:hypothetical protein